MPDTNTDFDWISAIEERGRAKCAEVGGVSTVAIGNWIKAGYIPATPYGRRVLHWLVFGELRRAGGKPGEKAATTSAIEDAKYRKAEADADWAEERAAKARLDRETLQGSLLEKAALKHALGASGTAQRTQGEVLRRKCELLVPDAHKSRFRLVFNNGWQRVLKAAAAPFDPLIK